MEAMHAAIGPDVRDRMRIGCADREVGSSLARCELVLDLETECPHRRRRAPLLAARDRDESCIRVFLARIDPGR